MIRIALVLFAVLAVGLIELPPLRKGSRRARVTVSVLLILSLVFGLMSVTMPEGPSIAKVITELFAPIGEALLGPM